MCRQDTVDDKAASGTREKGVGVFQPLHNSAARLGYLHIFVDTEQQRRASINASGIMLYLLENGKGFFKQMLPFSTIDLTRKFIYRFLSVADMRTCTRQTLLCVQFSASYCCPQ